MHTLSPLERHHQEKRSNTQIRIDLSMIPTHRNKDGTNYDSSLLDSQLENERESIHHVSSISSLQIKENLKMMELQLLTSPRQGQFKQASNILPQSFVSIK